MGRGHECIGHVAAFVSLVPFNEAVGFVVMDASTGHMFSAPGVSIFIWA